MIEVSCVAEVFGKEGVAEKRTFIHSSYSLFCHLLMLSHHQLALLTKLTLP